MPGTICCSQFFSLWPDFTKLLRIIFFLTRAIEAGANFLSEAFVFSVAASLVLAENWRWVTTALHIIQDIMFTKILLNFIDLEQQRKQDEIM